MNLAWTYEPIVVETIIRFVERAIPDTGEDWEEGTYEVFDAVPDSPHGRAWLVTYDIPTSVSGQDCWLSFVIDKESGQEPYVRDVTAFRSGRGEHRSVTYLWDDGRGEWEIAPTEDDRL